MYYTKTLCMIPRPYIRYKELVYDCILNVVLATMEQSQERSCV